MASLSTTELNATTDEKWDHDLDDARYQAGVILNRVLNKSALVKQSGDIVNLTYKPKLTVNTVGSNGTFTPTAYTLTNVQVAVNVHQYVAIETEDRAKAASFWDPESDFPKDAGLALGESYDTALAALYTDLTSNVIGDSTNPAPFDDVPVRTALLKLRDRNIPIEDLSFILPPIAFYLGLFTQDRFTDADKAGLPKNVLTTNFRFPLLGVPAYETTKVAVSGTAYKGLLLHKSTFAIAMQLNNKYARAERTAALVFSAVAAVESLYGVKTFREDHGVLINIRNS